jgi:hypothetical protein
MRSPEELVAETMFIEKAYGKAKLMFDKTMIKPEKFIKVEGFGQEVVDEDLVYVKEMEAKFEAELGRMKPEDRKRAEQTNKLALILEAIIHDHAELSEWLGSDVITIKTSKLDDYKNGVDTVAEFTGNKGDVEYLGLAIDVTFSSDVENKFKRIKQEIKDGTLAEVKYFKYKDKKTGEDKYLLKNVPRIIIGADINTIKELQELWLDKKMRELSKHPIQFQILEEIMIQLDVYEEYAEKHKKKEIVKVYRKINMIISKIYDKRIDLVEDTGKRDSLYDQIRSRVKNF